MLALSPAARCSSLPLTIAIAAAFLGAATARGQSCLCGTAADELVAAQVGLDREWVVQVPFDSKGWRLEHVVVGDRLVVAQAGDGTVAAIRADTRPGGPRRGAVAWSQRVGGTGPIEPPGIGSRSVVVARGRGITAYEADTGRMAWERPLAGMASAGALPVKGWVYAPLDAGGVDRLPEDAWFVATGEQSEVDIETFKHRFTIASQGPVNFSPVAFLNGVTWCSARGLIVAIVTDDDDVSKRIEFDLGSPASGPPLVRGGDIFVATRAGDIARIASIPAGLTANSGVITDSKGKKVPYVGWHTVLNEVPEGSPIVGGDTVVISLGPWGIAAFDALTGERRWTVSEGGLPLAITDSRVWCLDDTGFLVSRDLASGGRRDRLCLGSFTLPVINTVSERLVLASPTGLVVSLAPWGSSAATAPAAVAPPAATQAEPPAEADEAAPAAEAAEGVEG